MTEERRTKNTGFQRIIRAADASRKGAIYVMSNEAAFRQELILAALAILSAFIFSSGWFGILAVLSSWLLVLIVEVLNSAIEAVVDRISLEMHPLSGAAKDLGSFAVVLALANAFCWWVYAILA